MPSVEQVINQPLSGEEVKQIILAKLTDTLSRDTRLADYVAVPAFQFRLDIAIVLAGAVHSDVALKVEGGKGTVTDDPNQPSSIVTHHIEQSPMSPNEARLDADIGIPVLASDGKGRLVEKRVKYSKEAQERAKSKGNPPAAIPTVTAK